MSRRKSWKKKLRHWVLAHKYYPTHPHHINTTTTTTTTTTVVIDNNTQENNDTQQTTTTPRSSPPYFPSTRTTRTTSSSSTMVLRESPNSLSTSSKHVVIVMDALKHFSHEPLQWALDHVIASGYTVTLLGVMPWLNLPLSSKTWLDVWTLDLEDLSALRQRSEWNTDVKYQKVREVVQLCDKYGVVPCMKVEMGFPTRLLVLEQTTGLHASWVVFDRHHRKNRAFYAKRIPCNVVMMNGDGEMDILKKRPMIDKGENSSTNPGGESESPVLPPIIPSVILSEKLMGILRPIQEQTNEDQID